MYIGVYKCTAVFLYKSKESFQNLKSISAYNRRAKIIFFMLLISMRKMNDKFDNIVHGKMSFYYFTSMSL